MSQTHSRSSASVKGSAPVTSEQSGQRRTGHVPPTLCRVGLRMDDRDVVVIRTQMSGRGGGEGPKTNKQSKKKKRGIVMVLSRVIKSLVSF